MTHFLHCAHNVTLPLDRPRMTGILNVTPDSFSDGGQFMDLERATAHAHKLIDEGADVIDVGGESTRPGARAIPAEEQLRRTLAVIRRLRAQRDIVLSIDTTCAEVADAALHDGANIVNDVSAGTNDPRMAEVVSRHRAGTILMHRLKQPERDSYSDRYDAPPEYADVVATVKAFLADRAREAEAAGIARESIVLDPGLGFGKTVEQNYELIARIGELGALGYPVLSAASRKSFIGRVSQEDEPRRRVAGSLAVTTAHVLAGVRLFRVHDVAAHRQAAAVAFAICDRDAAFRS